MFLGGKLIIFSNQEHLSSKKLLFYSESTQRQSQLPKQILLYYAQCVLFLFDQMVEHKLITLKKAIIKLELLSMTNHRLPKKEIDKRLKEWGSRMKK